jgi:hypothetical protein
VTPSWPTSLCTASSAAADATRTATANAAALAPAYCCYTSITCSLCLKYISWETPVKCKFSWMYLLFICTAEKILARRNMIPWGHLQRSAWRPSVMNS